MWSASPHSTCCWLQCGQHLHTVPAVGYNVVSISTQYLLLATTWSAFFHNACCWLQCGQHLHTVPAVGYNVVSIFSQCLLLATMWSASLHSACCWLRCDQHLCTVCAVPIKAHFLLTSSQASPSPVRPGSHETGSPFSSSTQPCNNYQLFLSGRRRGAVLFLHWVFRAFVSVRHHRHETAGQCILHHLLVLVHGHVHEVTAHLAVLIPAHTAAASDHEAGIQIGCNTC